jgi:hypothetical protein
VRYVDGGVTNVDGTLSKRIVGIEHDITFDGDRKRPAAARLVLTLEDGERLEVQADSPHQHVNAYYGMPLREKLTYEDRGDGEFLLHFPWSSADAGELAAIEDVSVSFDQLMRFEHAGDAGWGIFEILTGGRSHSRYPNLPAMDVSAFRQQARKAERSGSA